MTYVNPKIRGVDYIEATRSFISKRQTFIYRGMDMSDAVAQLRKVRKVVPISRASHLEIEVEL